jgi:uncharacterized protein YbaR (Trm112 family)
MKPTTTKGRAVPADDEIRSQDIDARLLSMLVCPMTREALIYDRTAGELISRKAGLAYPIRDGIPIMLVDEARALTPEES